MAKTKRWSECKHVGYNKFKIVCIYILRDEIKLANDDYFINILNYKVTTYVSWEYKTTTD